MNTNDKLTEVARRAAHPSDARAAGPNPIWNLFNELIAQGRLQIVDETVSDDTAQQAHVDYEVCDEKLGPIIAIRITTAPRT